MIGIGDIVLPVYDPSTIPDERRIVTQRVIPYVPDQVFQAFCDPEVLANWWGPKGFTNTFTEFDFREGGLWRFTMHSPDGKDYPNESRFLRIAKPSLIIFDHLCAPIFQANLSFHEAPEGCQVHWQMIFEDEKTCTNVAKFAKDANEQNLDRLVAALRARQ